MDGTLISVMLEQGGPVSILALVIWRGFDNLSKAMDRQAEAFQDLRAYCLEHGRGKE